MPGIFVDVRDEDLIEVKTPYYEPYIKRIRQIDGARWGGEDDPVWILPRESAEDLDEEFFGELIYIYPRHELLDIDPPKPPKIYQQVPRKKVGDLKVKPYDFQEFGMNFLSYVTRKHGFAMLGDLMGCGKTFQAIGAALQLKQEGKVNKVLCVVLASVRQQWIEEIGKFTNESGVLFADFKAKYRQKNKKKYVAESIDDKKKQAIADFMKSDNMFLVMSYQTMQQNAKLIEKAKFDLVIFDEAHFIKNRLSKTNKAARQLIHKRTKRSKQGAYHGIPYTFFVSGTPIMNYPDELYALIGTASDTFFGSWRDYKKEYLVLNEYQDVVGYQNLDKMRIKIQSVLIRRTDKEIGMSLPQIIEDIKYIEPHPKQKLADKALQNEQKEMVKEKMQLLSRGLKDKAKQLEDRIKGIIVQRVFASNHTNLFQMSEKEGVRDKWKRFAVKNLYEIPKFEYCINLVEQIVQNGDKVVIFVESKRMTVLLHKEIKKFTKAVRYVGGLNDKIRNKRKHQFNNDPSCRVMIANAAGSTGLNLQAGRYLINYDLPHTPAIFEQRKYRIRRLDSTHDKVYIVNLINREMIDEQILNKLQTKQAAFDATIENDASTSQVHQDMVNKKKRKKKKKLDEDELISWN